MTTAFLRPGLLETCDDEDDWSWSATWKVYTLDWLEQDFIPGKSDSLPKDLNNMVEIRQPVHREYETVKSIAEEVSWNLQVEDDLVVQETASGDEHVSGIDAYVEASDVEEEETEDARDTVAYERVVETSPPSMLEQTTATTVPPSPPLVSHEILPQKPQTLGEHGHQQENTGKTQLQASPPASACTPFKAVAGYSTAAELYDYAWTASSMPGNWPSPPTSQPPSPPSSAIAYHHSAYDPALIDWATHSLGSILKELDSFFLAAAGLSDNSGDCVCGGEEVEYVTDLAKFFLG